jgi:hypothetical protein
MILMRLVLPTIRCTRGQVTSYFIILRTTDEIDVIRRTDNVNMGHWHFSADCDDAQNVGG